MAEGLLAYRLAMLATVLAVGGAQLADKGTRVFAFFTVWNWWLLGVFFALGAVASARTVVAARRGPRAAAVHEARPADALDVAMATAFHVVVPVSFVSFFGLFFFLSRR